MNDMFLEEIDNLSGDLIANYGDDGTLHATVARALHNIGFVEDAQQILAAGIDVFSSKYMSHHVANLIRERFESEHHDPREDIDFLNLCRCVGSDPRPVLVGYLVDAVVNNPSLRTTFVNFLREEIVC